MIDIPDYTQEEKKIIFSKFALPKVLKRIGLLQGEIVLTGEGLDELIEQYKNTSGIRDLEQAAEHLAANALYRIEVEHVKSVVFDAGMVTDFVGIERGRRFEERSTTGWETKKDRNMEAKDDEI